MSAWLAHSLGSRGHTWATIALCSIVLRQGQTSHVHSEAEAILEQRLLFVSLCEARMAFKRLWGIIVRIIPEASLTAPEDSAWLARSLGSGGHTRATIALCSIVLRQGQTSHVHSEAEAILEQRLLFVSLCEARMAFKRLWGIIVRIIPEASLTAPEDKCLVCTLTRKRRPY